MSLPGPTRFEAPPPPTVLPDNYRLVTSDRDEHEGPGLALLVIGILLIVASLVLFGVAAAVHQGVQSFNNACAQNPLCTPQSDPSGAITGAAVGVILLGVILLIVGVGLYRRD